MKIINLDFGPPIGAADLGDLRAGGGHRRPQPPTQSLKKQVLAQKKLAPRVLSNIPFIFEACVSVQILSSEVQRWIGRISR